MESDPLADIRDELDGDLNHPVVGYTILALAGGLAVFTAGESLTALKMPTAVVFAGIVVAAGIVPTVIACALHKSGF